MSHSNFGVVIKKELDLKEGIMSRDPWARILDQTPKLELEIKLETPDVKVESPSIQIPAWRIKNLKMGQHYWGPAAILMPLVAEKPAGTYVLPVLLKMEEDFSGGYRVSDNQNELILGLEMDLDAWRIDLAWIDHDLTMKIYIFYRPSPWVQRRHIDVTFYDPTTQRLLSFYVGLKGLEKKNGPTSSSHPMYFFRELEARGFLFLPGLTEGWYNPNTIYPLSF